MMLRIGPVAVALVACRGGDGGGKTVPNPVGPGEIISVELCGSTSENRGPCPNSPDNSIQIRVNGQSGLQCPCFNFSFLNQNLTDLGVSAQSTYEFTGFRPGTYTVTGQFTLPGQLHFTFWHNTSTSLIGVVPSSLQSLSGPASASPPACRVEYSTSNPNRTPVAFSFQFTVAAAASGGSC